jgi:hypothetical protein
MATDILSPRTDHPPRAPAASSTSLPPSLGTQARRGEPRPRQLPRRHRRGRPRTGGRPDPLVDAAGRPLDAVQAELCTTARDLADRETWWRTLGTVVAALDE